MSFQFKTLLITLLIVFKASADLPKWSFDAGPNPNTEMGKELIDLVADIPNMPEISDSIMGYKQKFRPAFGPIPWRMRQGRNQVKMLFIGQDGTHIAEASGRPATAGFGGRAQDLAKYFGVNESAAFINTYAFTIKGQYGVYNTPYFYTKNGQTSVRFSNFVSNQLWLMSMHQESPITVWRNKLIDWIIRNNKDSMKLIVTFGGAARDSVAAYAESKGAKVGTAFDHLMPYIQMAETKSEYAGGNNTYPSLVSINGGDLYEEMMGEKMDYTDFNLQQTIAKHLKENVDAYLKKAVFTYGGPYQNGLIHPAQLSGYEFDKMVLKGIKTRSLKGITLDDGTTLENDILIVELPHPSSLSRTVMEADSYGEGIKAASARVMRNVKALIPYKEKGWKIQADPGQTNQFDLGMNYKYGRSDIGPEFYDFGTPKNRMVSKSTARRMSRNANVVIIGTRDNGRFDMKKVSELTDALPSDVDEKNLFIARPKTLEERYTFDGGPSEKMAKLMVTHLDLKKIFKTKDGMNFETDGIAAFNVKSHPDVGYFGNYRGKFENPEVIILADPMGYDDIATSRALTGSRGQYLQALMNDLGVLDNYLVIKTVPFAMDGATDKEWNVVLKQTSKYRKAIFKEVFKSARPKLIITDGEYAQEEAKKLFKGQMVLNLKRINNDPKLGFKDLEEKLNGLNLYKNIRFDVRMNDIPRSHLSFYARTWEGTSGDRVITSRGKEYKGLAFAMIVPKWAYDQELELTPSSEEGIERLLKTLFDYGFPMPYEKISNYVERLDEAA
jgi:hypothetical protein